MMGILPRAIVKVCMHNNTTIILFYEYVKKTLQACITAHNINVNIKYKSSI